MENNVKELNRRLLLFAKDFVMECDYLGERFECGMTFKLKDGKEFNLSSVYDLTVWNLDEVTIEELEKTICDSESGNTLEERMEDLCYEKEDMVGMAGALIAEQIWDYTYYFELYGNHFADRSENEIAKAVCEALERLTKKYHFRFDYNDFFIEFWDESED